MKLMYVGLLFHIKGPYITRSFNLNYSNSSSHQTAKDFLILTVFSSKSAVLY